MVGKLQSQAAGVDSASLKAKYAKAIQKHLISQFKVSWWISWLCQSRVNFVRQWADDLTFEQLGIAYEIGIAYVKAHSQGVHSHTDEEHAEERPSQAAPLVEVVRSIERERQVHVAELTVELEALLSDWPEVCA